MRVEINKELEQSKTKAAKEVLQTMDSYENGDQEYQKIVANVAKKHGITIEQLNKELDLFI